MFHVQDGLYFQRHDDHKVTILKTGDGKEPASDASNVVFTQTLEDGPWCSVVLGMSAFSERPGDWHAWMRHHKGTEDLLVGKRGGY